MLEKTLESGMGEAIPPQLSTASKIEAVWSCSRGSGFGEIPVSKRGSPRKQAASLGKRVDQRPRQFASPCQKRQVLQGSHHSINQGFRMLGF